MGSKMGWLSREPARQIRSNRAAERSQYSKMVVKNVPWCSSYVRLSGKAVCERICMAV